MTDGDPVGRTRFDRLRSSELRAPLRDHAGLRYVRHGPGVLEEAMDVPPWLRDADGAVQPAALLVVADSTLAAAVATTIDADHVPVTRRLAVELLVRGPLRVHVVGAQARVLRADGGRATVRGEVHADGELVALASMRTAVVADVGRADVGRADVGRADAGVGGPATGTRPATEPVSTVGTAWPLEILAGDDTTTVARVTAQPWQANSIGTLHGGVVAAIGERALRVALAGPGGAAARRVVPLDHVVDYLRPVPADGGAVEVHAELVHRAGRFAVAHGRILRADGAVAALVRTTAELAEREDACSSG